MKYPYNINDFYINEYIYQIQNRIYNFEKKYKSELKNQTEIIIYQSWSVRKNYLINSKPKKLNTNNLQYTKLLKSYFLANKQMKKFIYFSLLDYILLVHSIKKNTNEIPKFLILLGQYNFLFLNFWLTNSILFTFATLNTKKKLYDSIIKNYNLKSLKLLTNITNIENKFICFPSLVGKNAPNFSHSKFLIKKCIKKKLKRKQLENLLKLKMVRQRINYSFSNMNFKIKLRYIFLTEKKNKDYVKIQKFPTNKITFLNTCYNMIFVKKLEKRGILITTGYDLINNIFTSLRLISPYIKYKFKNVDYSLTFFLLNSKKLRIRNIPSFHFHNPTLLDSTHHVNRFNISFNYNFKINYITDLRNSLMILELRKLKNSFKLFSNFFLIQFKTGTILFSLDKYIISVKLKNLLFFLFLLKPILETKRSQNYYLTQKNISKYESLSFLLTKLKRSSKYFIQTIAENYLNLSSNDMGSYFPSLKERLVSFELNSSQLKKLDKTLNFSSHLFRYFLKNYDFSIQHNSFYYNKGRKKNLNLVFFNILINGLPSILQNLILITNKKSRFFALDFITKTKNLAILEQKNVISVFKNPIFNDLPEILYSDSQIIIFTETATSLSQSLKILKEFLYLEGFIEQFSQFKVGHTLCTYNTNKPGFEFLGFFISHFLKLNHKNWKSTVSEPLFNSKVILKKSTSYELKFLPILKFSNLHSKTKKNLIITTINPSKKQILLHFEKLKKIIKISSSSTQEQLIIKLSSQIRIWSYYYNTGCNNKILNYCDYFIFKLLWRWACRRHPKKNKKWIKYKYFYQINGKNWIFGIYKNEDFSLFSLPNHIDMRFFKLIPPN